MDRDRRLPEPAVVDYNAAPVVPYAGSAIFVPADTDSPTNGRVVVPLPDLDYLLRWLDPAAAPPSSWAPAASWTVLSSPEQVSEPAVAPAGNRRNLPRAEAG